MSDATQPEDRPPPQREEPAPEAGAAQEANAPTQPAGTTAAVDGQPKTQDASTGVGSGAVTPAPSEDVKTKYGYQIVLAGLALVTVLYVATIIIFAILTPDNLANNVVASMGAITGVIGSLVAAYFGLQAGAAGKEAADAKAEQQSALASAAMGQLDSNKSQTAIQNAQQILQSGSR
jgi:hypothetical protein